MESETSQPAGSRQTAWLFRYSVLLALTAFFLVLSGGAAMSGGMALSAADRTSVAAVQQPSPIPAAGFFVLVHSLGGRALSVLALGLVVWLFAVKDQAWLRRVSWLIFLLVLAQAGLGEVVFASVRTGQQAGSGFTVVHAILAPIVFSATVVAALLASVGWRRGPEPAHDRAASSLRLLTGLLPLAVIAQIEFGASYRHAVFGVLPHMAGAAMCAFLALMLCLQVLQRFPKHRSLVPATLTLLGIVLLQVSLGIAVFVMELLHVADASAVLISTVAHIGNAALTLAASIVFAMQVLRNVGPMIAQQAGPAHSGSVRAYPG